MRAGEGRRFSVRAAAFCAAVFFGLGVYIPFFPLWLSAKGLSDAEIGTILAAPLVVRIALTPLLASIAERLPSLGVASAVYAGSAGMLFAMLAGFGGFLPTLIIVAAAVVSWYALLPLTDAVILAGVRHHGVDYARVRLWGSVGFVAASFVTALAIRAFATDGVFVVLVLCCFAGVAISLALPHVSGTNAPTERYGLRRALSDPVMRRALIAGNLILATHGVYYAFASLFWQSQGFGEGLIGGLWAFSVLAEVCLFWLVRFLPHWDARRCLIVGAIGTLVRWVLFPLVTWPLAVFALQTLHGVTFAVTHLGVMMAIGAVATPGHTARLQASHQLIGGIMLAATTACAGPLFRLSPAAAFWAMAVVAVPAMVLAAGLQRGLQPHSAVVGGATAPPE